MAKKYKMKYEIEHKFLPQIEELVETNASAIVLRVVQNVKRQMQEEVDNVTEKLELAKNERISELKEMINRNEFN